MPATSAELASGDLASAAAAAQGQAPGGSPGGLGGASSGPYIATIEQAPASAPAADEAVQPDLELVERVSAYPATKSWGRADTAPKVSQPGAAGWCGRKGWRGPEGGPVSEGCCVT